MIKPGDLVVVVKPTPCCRDASDVGRVFTVLDVRRTTLAYCYTCEATVLAPIALEGDDRWHLLSTLKKIEPKPTEFGELKPKERLIEVS